MHRLFALGRRLVFGGDDADVSLPKVEEVPSATTPNATTSSSSHVADDSSSLVVVKTAATLQEEEEEEEKEKSGDIGVGGGTYFLGVVEDTTTALRADVEKIEADLVNNEFSEEGEFVLATRIHLPSLVSVCTGYCMWTSVRPTFARGKLKQKANATRPRGK